MGNVFLDETATIVRAALGEDFSGLTIERAVFGLFFTGVKLSNGTGGLCFTPVKEIPEAVCCPSSARAMPLSGRLTKRSVADTLEDLNHDNVLRKALAIAVLNALSTTCWRLKKPSYEVVTGVDVFDEISFPDGGKTVVVGALIPILKKLLAQGSDFTVLEQDARTLKGRELDHYAPPEDAALYLPEADLAVITGVTILNDTLPDLLDLLKPGAEVIVTGPTASMLPDAYFRRGVTIMAGDIVTQADDLLDLISEGGSGYHFFGKSAEKTVIRRV